MSNSEDLHLCAKSLRQLQGGKQWNQNHEQNEFKIFLDYGDQLNNIVNEDHKITLR